MFHILFIAILISFNLSAQTKVVAEVECTNCVKESCRWEIRASSAETAQGKKIIVDWDKSIVSRHVEKPLALPLHCNVDRSFNANKGGFLRVWFEGELTPCDAMAVENPSVCGVEFKFGAQGPSEVFPSGFEVMAPMGKQLIKVEHYSTLFLFCGDFSKPETTKNYTWDSVIGFDAAVAGNGLYSKNTPAVPTR